MKIKYFFIVQFFFFFNFINGQCWKEVSNGSNHYLAIKYNGTLWSWGFNGYGQLGNGNTFNTSSPQQRGTNTDWKLVSTGLDFSLAIKNNNTMWSWGANNNGQLGINSTTSSLTPVQIGTDNDWIKFDSGWDHSLAIKQNGTLWAWGSNYGGRLGINSTVSKKLKPTQVGTDNDWIQISAGKDHSVAIKSNGTLWAFGSGPLGNNTTDDYIYPIQIGSDNDWIFCEAGCSSNTLAIKSDGTLWGWGWNYDGELGDGTTQFRLIPIQIGTDNDWNNISSDCLTTVARKNNGTIWAWGTNNYGQFGNGTTQDSLNPIQIGIENDWILPLYNGGDIIILKSDTSLWWAGSTYYSSINTNLQPVFCSNLSSEDFSSSNFKVFPNPSTDNINISISGEVFNQIKIFDINGRKVFDKFLNTNSTTIDVRNFQKGFYFLHVYTQNKIAIKKITII